MCFHGNSKSYKVDEINHHSTRGFKLEDREDNVPKCCYEPSYFTVSYILLDDLLNNFKALMLTCVLRGKGRGALGVKHSIS